MPFQSFNLSKSKQDIPDFGPEDPVIVITTSYLRGLAALVRIVRDRKTKDTRHLYEKIKVIWNKANKNWQESKKQNHPDFRHIFKAERNMRKLFLRFLFEKTVKFGNQEVKRIYKWHEGTTEKQNQLFSIAGSLLREYSMILYPFPLPTKGYKDYWARYEDERFGRVYVSHPLLPELDFMDMIRSHMYLLCAKIYQYNVPISAARRYLNRLLHDLLPFLDWVYGLGRQGVNSKRNSEKIKLRKFSRIRDMDKVLRTIVDDIKVNYDLPFKKVRISQAIKQREADKNFLDKEFRELVSNKYEFNRFKSQYRNFVRRHNIEEELINGESEFDHYFNLNAFYDFKQHISGKRKKIGSKCHQFMGMGLPQPFNMEDIICNGDQYAPDNSGYLLVAEQNISDLRKSGKADFVMFEKTKLSETSYWKPLFVLELKTKTAFDFDFYGNTTQSSDKSRVVLDYLSSRRSLTEEEWGLANMTALNSKTCNQLSTYSDLISKKYRQKAGIEDDFKPFQGVILLDTHEDWNILKSKTWQLIYSLTYKYRNSTKNELSKILSFNKAISEFDRKRNGLKILKNKYVGVFKEENSSLKLSIVPKPLNGNSADLVGQQTKISSPVKNPLKSLQENRYGGKEIILYHTVPSSTSGGPPASWISTIHHLFREIVEKKGFNQKNQTYEKRVLIVDLVGYLTKFRNQRLRVNSFSDTKFDKIEIISIPEFYPTVNLKLIIQTIERITSSKREFNTVVFLGIEQIRRIQKLGLHKYTQFNLFSLIQVLSAETNIFIDQPQVDIGTSEVYQRHTVLPRLFNKGLGTQLIPYTKIIWNLPTPPRTRKSKRPQYSSLRVILTCTKDTLKTKLIELPVLTDYHLRFYQPSKYSKATHSSYKIIDNNRKKSKMIKKSLDLVPWLPSHYNRLSSKNSIDSNTGKIIEPDPDGISFHKVPYSGYFDFLTYTFLGNKTKSDQYFSKDLINYRYVGRSSYLLKSTRQKTAFHPPNPNNLKPSFQLAVAVKQEISYIQKAIDFIFKKSILERGNEKNIEHSLFLILLNDIDQYISDKKTDEFSKDIENNSTRIYYQINSHITAMLYNWDLKFSKLLQLLEYDQKKFHNNYIESYMPTTINSKFFSPTYSSIGFSRSFVKEFGKSIMIFFIALRLNYPFLDEYNFKHLYRKYATWILKIIGYLDNQPDHIPKSTFHIPSIWTQLKEFAVLTKKTESTTDEFDISKYMTNIGYGLFIQNGNYTWLIIQNQAQFQNNTESGYNPYFLGLFSFTIKHLLIPSPIEMFEHAVNDKSVIIREIERLAGINELLDKDKNLIFTEKDQEFAILPCLLAEYKHRQFLWVLSRINGNSQIQEAVEFTQTPSNNSYSKYWKWKVIGRYHLDLNQTNPLSILRLGIFPTLIHDIRIKSIITEGQNIDLSNLTASDLLMPIGSSSGLDLKFINIDNLEKFYLEYSIYPRQFSMGIIFQILAQLKAGDYPKKVLVKISFDTKLEEFKVQYLDQGIHNDDIDDPQEEDIIGTDYFYETTELIEHFRKYEQENEFYEIIKFGKTEKKTKIHWNKFQIIYKENTTFLRPLITRNIPLDNLQNLQIPMSADELFQYKEENIVRLYINHIVEWCPLEDVDPEHVLKYQHTPLPLMEEEERKKAVKTQIFQHGKCWQLTADNGYFEEIFLKDQAKSGYSSYEIAQLYEQGEIYDDFDEKKYLLDFRIEIDNEKEGLVFRSDRLMVYLLRQIIGNFNLVQVDVLTWKLEERYEAIGVRSSPNWSTLSFCYQSLLSGEYHFYEIFGHKHECRKYRNYEYYINDLLNGDYKYEIYDKLENKKDAREDLLPYLEKAEEHIEDCDICKELDDKTEVLMVVEEFGFRENPLKLEMAARRPYENEVWTAGWDQEAQYLIDFLDQMISLVHELIEAGTIVLRDYFLVKTNTTLEEISSMLTKLLDELELEFEDIWDERKNTRGRANNDEETQSEKDSIKYLRRLLIKIDILETTENLKEFEFLDDFLEKVSDEYYQEVLDFQVKCNQAMKLLQKGEHDESHGAFQDIYFKYEDQLFADWFFLADLRVKYLNKTSNNKKSPSLQWFDHGLVLHYIASNYWLQGQYNIALDHFSKSLNCVEKGHFKDKANCLTNIGSLYFYFGDYELSLHYYELSLDIIYDKGTQKDVLPVLRNIARNYQYQYNLEKAKKYSEKALKLSKKLGGKWDIAQSLEMLGKTLQFKGEIDYAIDYFEQSLQIRKQIEDISSLTYTMYTLILLYNSQEIYQKSKAILEEMDELVFSKTWDRNIFAKKLISKTSYLHSTQSDDVMKYANKLLELIISTNVQPELHVSAWFVLLQVHISSIQLDSDYNNPLSELMLFHLRSEDGQNKQPFGLKIISEILMIWHLKFVDQTNKQIDYNINKLQRYLINTKNEYWKHHLKYFLNQSDNLSASQSLTFILGLINNQLVNNHFLLEIKN